jgi:predicted GNAT superfamily acetyltransferase
MSVTELAPANSAAFVAPSVTLRVLVHLDEFRECVSLQVATWGRDAETVPASLLLAAMKVGGLAIAAYDAGGTMIGFVFGVGGADEHGPLHWSHMLAVSANARGVGIGRALKERQRTELARRNVHRIAWTFDPLQSRNAHLNINRLGARVMEYVDDMYGSTASPLHLGMATDRLVVMSESDGPLAPLYADFNADGVPILTLPEAGGEPLAHGAPLMLLVEVPWNIEAIVKSDAALAMRWRLATRKHFRIAMARGCAVSGFLYDRVALRAYYCFTSASPPKAN